MENVWVTLLVGFGGVLVGAIGQMVIANMQERAHDRRELQRLAIEAAIADHQARVGNAERAAERGKVISVQPLSSSMLYHIRYMELVKRNQLTREKLIALNDEVRDLGDVGDDLHQILSQQVTS